MNRIARYAAMAAAGGATPVAVLTKADLCPDIENAEKEVTSLNKGLEVVSISSYTGYGLERLRAFFRPGVTIALLGSSGAGKLIELDGISFIDTPGLRELGMIDAEEGIDSTFSDIAELITRCAFSDCTHGNEPGCAVRQALENGTLTPERWKMFSRLEKENGWSKIRKNEKMMNIAMERRKLSNAQKKR